MPKRSPETNLLIDYLRSCAEQGILATYSDMHKHCRVDVASKRGILETALKVMQNEYGYMHECQTAVGYQFFRGDRAAKIIKSNFDSKIKSQVTRTDGQIASLDWSKLSPEGVKDAIAASIRVQAHTCLVSPSFTNKVDRVAGQSDKFLDSAKAAFQLMKDIS